MTEITDNIFLGGVVDANNPGVYTRLSYILNCTEQEIKYKNPRISVYKLGLTDEEENLADVKLKILKGARKLNEWTALSREPILVHCMAGISRSPSIILAYLIMYKGMGYDDAFKFVSKRHGFIRPNSVYDGILKELVPKDRDLAISRNSSNNSLSKRTEWKNLIASEFL
jgi:hypothetical protein